ncbi:MAG TPA: cell division protein ZapA [Alphaproteobacteria bacterium]|nr:cell division protein ZapA [Alphaproteobacteria bacterium]
MKPIEIHLMGRSYQIACTPGEEKKLLQLAAMLEEKMIAAAKTGQGAIGEVRLLLLAGLMLADDILETRNEGEQNMAEMRRKVLQDEDLMVAAVDHLAGRISALAARIESN